MTIKQKSLSPSPIELKPISIKETQSINIGSVVNTTTVNLNQTVLSAEFQSYGGYIDLENTIVYDNWGRMISSIPVPPIEATYEMGNTVAILHPIARRANNVLCVFNAYKNQKQTLIALQKSINNYFLELCQNLFGKNGIYNRYILGPRMQRSFRAVIIPGRYENDPYGESFEWVGIPTKICHQLKIEYGQKVIIGRDPTIWFGSLEVLRAYPVLHDAIELHPLLLPQLGGDHDGDQIWGYCPIQEIEDEHVAYFTKKYAKWNKNLTDNNEEVIPHWNDYSNCNLSFFKEDEEKRIKTTGLSISPLDIVNNSQDLQRILTYCGKGERTRGQTEHSDLVKAYKQMHIKEWLDLTHMINHANLGMKIFIGPVGLVSLRLAVLGHNVKSIQEASNLLAERCAQSLLDAKHLSIEEIREYKPAEIFKILNLQIKEIKTTEEMYQRLKAICGCDERVIPVLDFIINDGRGLSKLSQEEFPLFEGTTFTGETAEDGYTPSALFIDNLSNEEGIFSNAFITALKLYNENKDRNREFISRESISSQSDSQICA
jgi:hypothetical protein